MKSTRHARWLAEGGEGVGWLRWPVALGAALAAHLALAFFVSQLWLAHRPIEPFEPLLSAIDVVFAVEPVSATASASPGADQPTESPTTVAPEPVTDAPVTEPSESVPPPPDPPAPETVEAAPPPEPSTPPVASAEPVPSESASQTEARPDTKVESEPGVAPTGPVGAPGPASQSFAPDAGASSGADADLQPVGELRPRYPMGARLRGEEGAVTLALSIGGNGRVVRAVIAVSSGSVTLDGAALAAVQRARFRDRAGRYRAGETRLTFRFKLVD